MNFELAALAAALFAWAILAPAHAQEFPHFNIQKGCNHWVLEDLLNTVAAQTCVTGEETAKASVAMQWSGLNAATRTRALQDMDENEPKAYTALQYWIDQEQLRTLRLYR